MPQRKPLDPTRIAQYMSAKTANAVFGQKLSDPPAYVGKPVTHIADRSGYTASDLEKMRGGFGNSYQAAREALKQRHIDQSWQSLRDSEAGSQEEACAVAALSDIVFGDNEIAGYIDALDGNMAKLAAETQTPPVQFLGELLRNVRFYGVVSDHPPTSEQASATIEFARPLQRAPGDPTPGWYQASVDVMPVSGWQVLGTIGEDGFK